MHHLVTCNNNSFEPIIAYSKEDAEMIKSFIVGSWDTAYPYSSDVPDVQISEADAPVEAWEVIQKHIKWHVENEVAIAKRKVINEIHG